MNLETTANRPSTALILLLPHLCFHPSVGGRQLGSHNQTP